jgi:hypothetical protein
VASNINRIRDQIIEIKQVIVVDHKGKQYSLDPKKITLVDKETNKPLFQETEDAARQN